jgi:hypothetical protein
VFHKTVIDAKRNKQNVRKMVQLEKSSEINRDTEIRYLHRTPLKSARQHLSAFQKSFVNIQKMWRLKGRKGKKSKENSVPTHNIQKSCANLKRFGVKWLRIYKFNLI